MKHEGLVNFINEQLHCTTLLRGLDRFGVAALDWVFTVGSDPSGVYGLGPVIGRPNLSHRMSATPQ